MPRTEPADLDGLIEALVGAGVEFIVVGGAAAVLHGAPTTTWDLDIVHRRTSPECIDRLMAFLEEHGAVARDPAGRKLTPGRGHLEAGGQLLLLTDLGPLDLLGRLHDGRGYEELLDHSDLVRDESLEFRVLDLPTLIEVKRGAGRAKDRLVLPILLALQEEKSR